MAESLRQRQSPFVLPVGKGDRSHSQIRSKSECPPSRCLSTVSSVPPEDSRPTSPTLPPTTTRALIFVFLSPGPVAPRGPPPAVGEKRGRKKSPSHASEPSPWIAPIVAGSALASIQESAHRLTTPLAPPKSQHAGTPGPQQERRGRPRHDSRGLLMSRFPWDPTPSFRQITGLAANAPFHPDTCKQQALERKGPKHGDSRPSCPPVQGPHQYHPSLWRKFDARQATRH